MKQYNKLVRDKIPEIISAKGGTPKTRILDDAEYQTELGKKLLEETNEYLQDPNINELADILEVMHAILDVQNKTFADLEIARAQKAKERGGFRKRLFLETVEE
jgi:predicted house-cleaning noncanonical NTP pyrophosphatase (MazG superfamily)